MRNLIINIIVLVIFSAGCRISSGLILSEIKGAGDYVLGEVPMGIKGLEIKRGAGTTKVLGELYDAQTQEVISECSVLRKKNGVFDTLYSGPVEGNGVLFQTELKFQSNDTIIIGSPSFVPRYFVAL